MPDSEKDTITMVCTGNTCRSPMAEKLLEHALKAEEAPLNTLKVRSAGLSAFEGTIASGNSVKAIEKIGLSLDDHRSHMLNDELMNQSYAVFCMTRAHLEAVKSHFGNSHENIHLMREFVSDNGADDEIPDPIGQDLPAYENCRDSMVEAIPSIIKFLKDNYK